MNRKHLGIYILRVKRFVCTWLYKILGICGIMSCTIKKLLLYERLLGFALLFTAYTSIK